MDVEKHELGGLENYREVQICLRQFLTPLRHFCRKCRGCYRLKNKNSYLNQTDSLGFDPSSAYLQLPPKDILVYRMDLYRTENVAGASISVLRVCIHSKP